ncbi:MAG: RNA polymerase subunit sigma-24 [Pseudomonadota bacterium]|nr:RNA polymerase subunit sigma-24 [Pseudomonadota bacterium]
MSSAAVDAVDEIFRREGARVLATLVRVLGDFDMAEEARQEAFAAAVEQWNANGLPANPLAWLIQAGRNKAVDRIRRDVVFKTRVLRREFATAAADAQGISDEQRDFTVDDDRLRLIFICCHPALRSEAQIALTLREVCGLTTQAVARAFLVSDETIAQRIVRAKRKIRDAGIPFEEPEPGLFDQRLQGVLAVVYSVFTEGYAATAGPDLVNTELCAEAIRLGRLLDLLLPENPAIMGLLALMLLHDARCSARTSPEGDVVLLEDQDRSRWDEDKIAEGLGLVDRALNSPGHVSAYAVQAAIAALHVRSEGKETTDWRQIVGLYEVLLKLQPTPVVELNHAVAVSMVDGAERALDLIGSLAARGEVKAYHLLHAARGRLLQQLGRHAAALDAYREALDAVSMEPERRLLRSRIASLEASQTKD